MTKHLEKVKDKISFEYDQFVANFDNGYRADLCVWQWVDEPTPLTKHARVTVDAKRGWQASSILLNKDKNTISFVRLSRTEMATGSSKHGRLAIFKKPVTAQGNPRGEGKLVGVILKDYELGEPFEIGAKSVGFKAPESGQLYLRCQEKWNALADNNGQINVYVRKTPSK